VDNVLYKDSEELSMERSEGQWKGKSRERAAGDLLEAALSTEFGGSLLSKRESEKGASIRANP